MSHQSHSTRTRSRTKQRRRLRSLRGRFHDVRPFDRQLRLEILEDRCLLAAMSSDDLFGVPELQLDATAFASDRILVRFADGVSVDASSQSRQLTTETNLWRVGLDGDVSVGQALQAFRGRSDVVYAQPDYRIRLADWYDSDPPSPSDALYQCSMLWGLNNNGTYEGVADADIDAPEAWKTTRGDSVIVAVIDSGVDYSHLDLENRMWSNSGEIADNGVDDDGNGYVDDIYGWDFANDDADPMDDNGHGTHVAGTIAATANNDSGGCSSGTGLGIIGVAPEAEIMALKFLDASGYGYTSDAIAALSYAVDNGAAVSNNSYGDTAFEQAMLDAISDAAQADHLFVAAAGNGNWFGFGQNNDSRPFYPASYQPTPDTVIAVAASDSSDGYPRFSNYGPTSVDLAAPGYHIWSTIPDALDTVDGSRDGYARKDGTSMASPHVAGVAALVWSLDPSLSATEVKQILLETVDPISGRDTVTDGRLNAGQAVAAVSPADQIPTVGITAPTAGETVAGMITVTANANDDQGVPQVAFFADGAPIGTDNDGGDGWSMQWDTTGYSEGSHTLRATAMDTIGQIASNEILVYVDNTDDPPTVSIVTPIEGDTVAGTVNIEADAFDDRGVEQVEFFVDGDWLGIGVNGDDGWSLNWDTTTAEAGLHTLTATATDTSGKSSSDAVDVTVDNTQSVMHVADLDAQTKIRGKSGKWEVFVTAYIVDQESNAVSSANVVGDWTGAAGGSVTGVTDAGGAVTFATGSLSGGTSVTFTIVDVARSGFTYDVGANIDLDGDSDGTTITVHNDAAASRAKQSSSVLFRPAFAIGQNVLRFELATLQTRSATAVLSQQELAFDNPGDGTLVWMIRVAPGPSLVSAEDLEFGKPTPTSEGLSIAIDRIFTEFIEEHDSIRLFALE